MGASARRVDLGRGSLAINRQAGQFLGRNPIARVAIFPGVNDGVVPFELGRKLGQVVPFVEFFPVNGAGHVSVLTRAKEEIIDWMNRGSTTIDSMAV